MTNKILLLNLFLILFIRTLWAQSEGGGGRYVIEQRYVQDLVWIGDDYTLKYEVVIEQNDGVGAPGGALDGASGGYKTYIREFTKESNFQVSLPLGKYRYRIIPYDYLEQPGEALDWVYIEIKPAPFDSPVIAGVEQIEKQINLYASAAWSPLIPLYGRMTEIFGNEFFTAGASVRFGALFNKPRWFSPGIELSTSWFALEKADGDDKFGIQTGATGINFVAQKKLPYPTMAVTLRAGFALAFQVGEINIENYSYTTGGLIPQINFEASFLWFAYKNLFLEAGLGFAHLMDKSGNSGCLRPWIGAGWRF